MLTNIAGFLLPFYLDLFCLKQTESIYDAYTLLCLHIAFWSLLVLVAAILCAINGAVQCHQEQKYPPLNSKPFALQTCQPLLS